MDDYSPRSFTELDIEAKRLIADKLKFRYSYLINSDWNALGNQLVEVLKVNGLYITNVEEQ